MSYTFTLGTTIPAAPKAVYDAWLDSRAHSAMTGGKATQSPKVGGKVTAWDGYIEGKNLALKPGKQIVQSWRTSQFTDAHDDSTITVTLAPVKGGTRLTLKHANVPDGQTSYEKGGWQANYFAPMKKYFAKVKSMDAVKAAAKKKTAKKGAARSKTARKAKPERAAEPAAKPRPARAALARGFGVVRSGVIVNEPARPAARATLGMAFVRALWGALAGALIGPAAMFTWMAIVAASDPACRQATGSSPCAAALAFGALGGLVPGAVAGYAVALMQGLWGAWKARA